MPRRLAAALVLLALSTGPALAQPTAPPNPVEQAYAAGDFEAALRLADAAIRRDRLDHLAHYYRGSAKIELGLRTGDAARLRAGIADAREAIRLDGQTETVYYLPYLYGMTNLSVLEGRPDHADVAARIATDIVARDGLKLTDKGAVYYQRGLAERVLERNGDAVASFEEALRLDPGLLAAHTAKAETLVAAGDLDAARRAFDRAATRFPDVPLVFNNRGMFRQQSGDLAGAVEDFTRALRLDGGFFYALTNRGFALLLDGSPEAAIADFDASLDAFPEQPAVFGLRGQAYLLAGDLSAAIADHREATRLAPDAFQARADLGFALFFAGETADAIDAFEMGLELEPGAKQLRPWLVAARRAAGETVGEDDPLVTASLAVAPADRDWVDALLAFQFGRITDEQLLDSVVDDDEEAARAQRCEAHYFAGLADQRAGDADAARAHFRAAIESDLPLLASYRGATFGLR